MFRKSEAVPWNRFVVQIQVNFPTLYVWSHKREEQRNPCILSDAASFSAPKRISQNQTCLIYFFHLETARVHINVKITKVKTWSKRPWNKSTRSPSQCNAFSAVFRIRIRFIIDFRIRPYQNQPKTNKKLPITRTWLFFNRNHKKLHKNNFLGNQKKKGMKKVGIFPF